MDPLESLPLEPDQTQSRAPLLPSIEEVAPRGCKKKCAMCCGASQSGRTTKSGSPTREWPFSSSVMEPLRRDRQPRTSLPRSRTKTTRTRRAWKGRGAVPSRGVLVIPRGKKTELDPNKTPGRRPFGVELRALPTISAERSTGQPTRSSSVNSPAATPPFHQRRRPRVALPRFPANATGGGRFEQILRRRLVAHFGRCHGIRATILSTACHPGSVMNSI